MNKLTSTTFRKFNEQRHLENYTELWDKKCRPLTLKCKTNHACKNAANTVSSFGFEDEVGRKLTLRRFGGLVALFSNNVSTCEYRKYERYILMMITR